MNFIVSPPSLLFSLTKTLVWLAARSNCGGGGYAALLGRILGWVSFPKGNRPDGCCDMGVGDECIFPTKTLVWLAAQNNCDCGEDAAPMGQIVGSPFRRNRLSGCRDMGVGVRLWGGERIYFWWGWEVRRSL